MEEQAKQYSAPVGNAAAMREALISLKALIDTAFWSKGLLRIFAENEREQ